MTSALCGLYHSGIRDDFPIPGLPAPASGREARKCTGKKAGNVIQPTTATFSNQRETSGEDQAAKRERVLQPQEPIQSSRKLLLRFPQPLQIPLIPLPPFNRMDGRGPINRSNSLLDYPISTERGPRINFSSLLRPLINVLKKYFDSREYADSFHLYHYLVAGQCATQQFEGGNDIVRPDEESSIEIGG